MKKTAIVNIYNFIRMSHMEPSRFIEDDFETVRQQLILVKQMGFPATWALKYDALMDARYQALLREYLDENDDIGVWWEITEPLCRRAGVTFQDSRNDECYDDRVDSAYSLGYEPEARRALVDAYMADFREIFGQYPTSIGSWVLDSVTVGHARAKYGVEAACICRDQMGVDGFTLWGGWPNGIYYPSRKNLFMPASSVDNQLDIPVFRLLGPDPIYNFEADVRPGLAGVYTLEPSWVTGRDPEFIRWYFSNLIEEDTLGIGYAQVGQENNFLWENIKPGLVPQLRHLKERNIRVETMAATARWFRHQYRLTPPMSYQASTDWTGGGLQAQWYASPNYRLGLLAEGGRLRIRDLFLYREDYPCRYANGRMRGVKSLLDALPVLFPQVWGGEKDRPYLRLVDNQGREPEGEISFGTLDDQTAAAWLCRSGVTVAQIHMDPAGLTILGEYNLRFDRLPVLKAVEGQAILLEHEGFRYRITVTSGTICRLDIIPENGKIRLEFGPELERFETEELVSIPRFCPVSARAVSPQAPEASPGDSVFPWGSERYVNLACSQAGTIFYRLNGGSWRAYAGPILLKEDGILSAYLSTEQGQSETATWHYRFARKDLKLTSPTRLDRRPVFAGEGIQDLLQEQRATLDFIDGHWRGTLEDLDVTAEFAPGPVESVSLGFLSHHRSGIVYPQRVELYVGPDRNHLRLQEVLRMPEGPGTREIEKMDAVFHVAQTIGAFRILTVRHQKMPQWCCYRGSETVFTMTDCLVVRPGEEEAHE